MIKRDPLKLIERDPLDIFDPVLLQSDIGRTEGSIEDWGRIFLRTIHYMTPQKKAELLYITDEKLGCGNHPIN